MIKYEFGGGVTLFIQTVAIQTMLFETLLSFLSRSFSLLVSPGESASWPPCHTEQREPREYYGLDGKCPTTGSPVAAVHLVVLFREVLETLGGGA